MSMKGIVTFDVNRFKPVNGQTKLMLTTFSHISEKAIRRRYGRSPRNVRAFIYLYNRLGHRGTSALHIPHFDC